MPLTKKGNEIMANMEKEYGPKKDKSVFYASKNAGKISGVDCGVRADRKTLPNFDAIVGHRNNG
jgi:hypothetical protein